VSGVSGTFFTFVNEPRFDYIYPALVPHPIVGHCINGRFQRFCGDAALFLSILLKNMTQSSMKRILLTGFIVLLFSIPSFAQQLSSSQRAEAQSRLQTMSPEEIDAKIKSLGMTREEAEKRAKENGIDLNTYLTGSTGTTAKSSGVLPEATPILESGPLSDTPLDKSIIEKDADKQKPVPGPKLEGLPYFGYDIFTTTPAAFEPNASGPVDADYQIGPEDVLRVSIWGQVEQQPEAEVDKEGRIFIPTAGPIVVSGLTLQKATTVLTKQLSRSFQGLTASPPTVWLDVTLAKIRPKRVFIMGEVKNPGGYTVNSYANVFNTLFAVGGPTTNGSLREIRLIRGDKVIAKVDLYAYLTGADKNNDIRVQSNDIIYVPVRKNTISLKGEVRKPAIYELLPNENIQKLLDIAGGALATAYLERIQLARIISFKDRQKNQFDRQIIDVNFRDILAKKKEYKLEDGDEITIFSILDMVKNFATISGAVYRPGTYQLQPKMRLTDLIKQADSLQPFAYLSRADILRTRPDKTLQSIQVDLSKALKGDQANNILIDSLDQVKIYSKYDVEITDDRTVSISGHIKNPGTFPYSDSLTLFDIIFQAGGLQDSLYRAQTFLYRGELLRLSDDNLTKITVPFDLQSVIDSVPEANIPLLPMDEVIIHSIEMQKLKNDFVEIRGSVKKPGRYNLTNNMTLIDLLMLAGGYTEDAWAMQAEIARLDRKKQDDTISYIYFSDLPDLRDTNAVNSFTYFQNARKNDFELKQRDHVFIRPDPNFQTHKIVSISGEVNYPGDYTLRTHNEYLSDVITRAGGPTTAAYIRGGSLFRNDERMNVDFYHVMDDPKGDDDIVLHNGDKIIVPKKPNAVRMNGQVNNPGLLGFIDGEDMWDYINRAGGLTDSADYIILYHPNGNAEKFSTGCFGGDTEVYDGSTIIATKIPIPPPEREGESVGQIIRDLFAIAASALTILVLAKQL
jgi:polysaccharide export outer membrane protein